jgi:hypothetical protein
MSTMLVVATSTDLPLLALEPLVHHLTMLTG